MKSVETNGARYPDISIQNPVMQGRLPKQVQISNKTRVVGNLKKKKKCIKTRIRECHYYIKAGEKLFLEVLEASASPIRCVSELCKQRS